MQCTNIPCQPFALFCYCHSCSWWCCCCSGIAFFNLGYSEGCGVTRLTRKRHSEVEKITLFMKIVTFYSLTVHKKQQSTASPCPSGEHDLLVLMVKSHSKESGLDNSRACSCEHIQEGNQASRWSKIESFSSFCNQAEWKFPSWPLPWQSLAVVEPFLHSTFRPCKLISRSFLCFILEDFLLPRLCWCLDKELSVRMLFREQTTSEYNMF